MRKFSKIVEEWDDDGWGEGVNFNDNVDSELMQKIKDSCAILTDNGFEIHAERLNSTRVHVKIYSILKDEESVQSILSKNFEYLGESLDRLGEFFEICDYISGCTKEQRSLSNGKYWINITLSISDNR